MTPPTATAPSDGQSSSSSPLLLPTTYLLLDLNGNLHVGDAPTPNAISALSRLSRRVTTSSSSSSHRRLRIAFCSNSSKESTRSLVSRLRKMGFTDEEALPEGSVFTSLDAARRRLLADEQPSERERGIEGRRRMTLLLLGDDAMQSCPEDSSDEANSAPSSSSSPPSRYFKPPPSTLPADLDATQRQALESCDSVLIGLAPGLMRYEWLTEAFRILSGEYAQQQSTEQPRPAPLLVATHSGRYLRPGDGGALALGPGPFVKALCHAADLDEDDERTVVCVGKPERQFFAQCLEGMGWQRQQQQRQQGGGGQDEDEAWIVGDDARQDLSLPEVKEGKEDPLDGLRVRRALVRTGKYREGDQEKVTGREAGDVGVWDSFAAWVDEFVREWGRGE